MKWWTITNIEKDSFEWNCIKRYIYKTYPHHVDDQISAITIDDYGYIVRLTSIGIWVAESDVIQIYRKKKLEKIYVENRR